MQEHLPALSFTLLLGTLMLTSMASAVIQEDVYMGRYTGYDAENSTITISVEYSFGCRYSNESITCGFDPIVPPQELTGSSPDPAAPMYLSPGTIVEATQEGGNTGPWIAIGIIAPGPDNASWYAMTEIGEPNALPLPLAGGYQIDTHPLPDCESCIGTVCNAKATNITLKSGNMTVGEATLLPGGTYQYSGRNDNSSVSVLFVKGEASSSLCPDAPLMTGPQPVSDYIINIQPPIGFPSLSGTTGEEPGQSDSVETNQSANPTRNFLASTTESTPVPWFACTAASLICALLITRRPG